MASAFGYLLDRSVGLPSRAYRDNVHSRQSTELLQHSPSASNFIFRQGMRVWGFSLDPVEQRFLLVGVTSLAYTPDGRFLLSNGMDEKLRLWNATSGEHQFMNYEGVRRAQPRAARNVQMAVVQEGGAWESTLVFVPNGSEGALSSYRVFGDSGAPLASATAHYQQITACLYRKTTRELYSAGEDGLIMKWKPPPVDLYPDISNDENGDTGVQNRESGTAIDDEDAWSEDDDEETRTGHEFIPPILRNDF
ncbi:hypothetical protein PC112_g16565 [Phytophthora cactorum]|nr:hypothetical protein PC112_g16565 [Phytophthora cactorum]